MFGIFYSVCFQMLQQPGPYPNVVIPPDGGYWVDGVDNGCVPPSNGSPRRVVTPASHRGTPVHTPAHTPVHTPIHTPTHAPPQMFGETSTRTYQMERDETAQAYRKHFLGKVRIIIHFTSSFHSWKTLI